jgi:sugar/nucleoside kinase (ribokinase family)
MFAIPGSILISGNLVQDIVVAPVQEIRFGGTVWVDRIEQHMGGNGANTAYAAALLGAPVRLIGMTGNDIFGHQIRGRLLAAGVDLGLLEFGNEATASSVVLVREDGARAFLHRPGVSREVFRHPFLFSQANTSGCSHYHLANPFSLFHLRPIAHRLLQEARELGLSTSLDTAWDSLGEWMKVLEPCLQYLDLLFVNEDEARILTGEPDPDRAAVSLRKGGARAVVVKLGSRGSIVFDDGIRIESPAFPVTVADTTGAGDCFVGGFLAGLRHGYHLERVARLANAVGARSVTALGSTTGLLPLEQTLAWAGQTHR